MKNSGVNSIFTIIIAISMACTLLLGTAAAAGEIYVNPDGESIGTGLDGVYVIGGDGSTAQLDGSGAWAITGSGLTQIGSSAVTPAEPTTPPSGTIRVKTSVIKVGLDYYYSSGRNSSVATATLTNYVGSGYIFGFYDANRSFFEVGRTSETKLTMMKDTNVTVSAGTVGCYHIRLPETYSNFNDANTMASAYNGGFPAYYDGSYYVLVGNYKSEDDARSAIASLGIGGEAFSASSRCVVVTKTGSTQILFEFDCGSAYSLAVRPISGSGKAETTYNGNFRYYGDFQFIRTTGENMTVVNVLPLEDYVKGVVPYEMSSSWPLEALKAQALCARTYVMSNIGAYSSYGFDVTDDTYCQAYCGTRSANATTDKAVDETAGLYVTYNGSLCETLYFSSDGGATENSENVFTNTIAYLRGVIDPYEADIEFSNKSWTAELTAAQITSKLQAKGYSVSTIVSVKPEYTAIGNMGKLTFTDVNGKSVTVSKSGCYNVLGLKSIHFTIAESPSKPGTYLIEGGGWGHNVGMSQWGAYSMAGVHGYSYAQIIGFYYTGVTIAKGIAA